MTVTQFKASSQIESLFEVPTPRNHIIPSFGNLVKSVFLISVLLTSFYLTQQVVNGIDTYFSSTLGHQLVHNGAKWIFVILMAFVHGFILSGIGILGHEALHRVLFKNQFFNDLWGGILYGLVLIPFYSNREFHLIHHRHAHQPGLDPEEKLNNYPFWFAFFAGVEIGFYELYRTLVKSIIFKFFDKHMTGQKDILFLSMASIFYFYCVPALGISVWYTFVPTFLVFPMIYSYRALSDHYSMPIVTSGRRVTENGTPVIDSWIVLVNPFLTWLWSSINYHQVHHRYPYLSHKYLRPTFEATKDREPYAVVHGYLRSLWNLRTKSYRSDFKEIEPFLWKNPSS